MIKYAGLDVHKRVVEACVLDAEGQILMRERFDLSPSKLSRFARRYLGAEAKVAVEATTNTWAIVRLLKPHVGEVVVSNPLATKAIAQAKVKTDKVDALVLANRLRSHEETVWYVGLKDQGHVFRDKSALDAYHQIAAQFLAQLAQ